MLILWNRLPVIIRKYFRPYINPLCFEHCRWVVGPCLVKSKLLITLITKHPCLIFFLGICKVQEVIAISYEKRHVGSIINFQNFGAVLWLVEWCEIFGLQYPGLVFSYDKTNIIWGIFEVTFFSFQYVYYEGLQYAYHNEENSILK